MTVAESSEELEHDTGTEKDSVTNTSLSPEVIAVRDLIISWLTMVPVGINVLNVAVETLRAVAPDDSKETFGEGVDAASLVTNVHEGRRIALSLEPVEFSGTGDLLPYPVWKRRFDLLRRSNGLLGDPVSIFYALNRCLSPALVLTLDPSPPGLGPVGGWVAEIARIFRFLSQSCSGVSFDIARVDDEQRFAVTCQKPNESIADYVVRFSNAASDLAAYTGKSVSEDKLRTNFIRGILVSWRLHALDILSRGDDFITLVGQIITTVSIIMIITIM
ncbi:hypothetical protein Pmar_PMAR028879 [Perkinsus marinus ATCC 50983]|uniref:Retrotransposon gag domain-containing protein n=1 Tax=Perkinsus marinus (strain ATCC 50983 / TXsc) TaxID=423536 RepID=C5L8F6_PERM5|nr:hypothetical protein Pmar_PMAR028879 [Perkinsus marinus ATCC 50983]EER06976.1 hypothetical protein Pmar_PMAR028879 [Perkinsus marinus ATCC 50983]|eukprot:XP_002775160.1 hypothetical protein Pmar_PMAR028879 [Perkinsus marinus ATCC 50983]